MFRDWNFSIAVIFMFLIGIILLGTMALVTPYIQNLMGYPVLSSGELLGARGIGTFFSMMAVGRLLGKIDARILIGIGLVLATGSLYVMVGWTPDVSAREIAIDSVFQGVGLGLIFVPLNTVAFATLPGAVAHRRRGGLDADPQPRLVGRHFAHHRQAHRQHLGLPQPARRVHQPVQRRFEDAGGGCALLAAQASNRSPRSTDW